MISKIKSALKSVFFTQEKLESMEIAQKFATCDSHALQELFQLGLPFIPRTSYSLSPVATVHLINEAIINKRNHVLEVGSGVSTVYLAKALSIYRPEARILSIDESGEWQQCIKDILTTCGLDQMVRFAAVPIDNGRAPKWFDERAFLEGTGGRKFDLVLVDAPSTVIEGSRMPFADFCSRNQILADDFAILVDDTCRTAEHALACALESSLKGIREDYQSYNWVRSTRGWKTQPLSFAYGYRLKRLRERDRK